MRRWLLVAAVGAAFLVTQAWGQRHGGGFAGHGGFGSRGAVGGMHGPGNRGFGGSPGFHGFPFGRPFFPGRPFFHHRHFGPGFYGYGYGWYGYPESSVAYSDYPAEYYPSEDYLRAFNPQTAQIQEEQQAELDRLNNEVARLREQRESRPDRKPENIQLVFGDRHTEEVQNYAIVGQMLWVFSEQQARKIPLANLDVPATQKANDDRGVDFRLPTVKSE